MTIGFITIGQEIVALCKSVSSSLMRLNFFWQGLTVNNPRIHWTTESHKITHLDEG